MNKNHCLIEYSEQENDHDFLKENINKFNKKTANKGIIISFVYSTKEAFNEFENFNYYRDFLNQQEEISIFTEAYNLINSVIKQSSGFTNILLNTFYYSFAGRAIVFFTLKYYYDNYNAPVLFILDKNETAPVLKKMFAKYIPAKKEKATERLLNLLKIKTQKKPTIQMPCLSEEEVNLSRKNSLEANADHWHRDKKLPGRNAIVIITSGSIKKTMDVEIPLIKSLHDNYTGSVVVFTHDVEVTKLLKNIGVLCFNVPSNIDYDEYSKCEQRLNDTLEYMKDFANKTTNVDHCKYLFGVMEKYLPGFTYQASLHVKTSQEIFQKLDVELVFSIGIDLNFSYSLGITAKAYHVQWYVYTHMLFSNHPESRYFPAEKYLTYGQQAKELCIKNGVNPNQVEIVGSIIFDNSFHERKKNDEHLAYLKSLLPNWSSERIIVIATEHSRSGEYEHIQSIINHIKEIPNVFMVLKLHPDDYSISKIYENLADKYSNNIKISVIKNCNLHALLHIADILLCERSNIIINAALLNTITILSDFSGNYEIIDFAQEGIGIRPQGITELKNLIEKLLGNQEFYDSSLNKIQQNLKRFTGFNDGKTVSRITKRLVSTQSSALVAS